MLVKFARVEYAVRGWEVAVYAFLRFGEVLRLEIGGTVVHEVLEVGV